MLQTPEFVSDRSQAVPIRDSNELFGALMSPFLQPPGAWSGSERPLVCHHDMHPLQVVGQTDQAPLTSRCQQASQRKLAEPQYLFDDADDRFHGRFAQAIDLLAKLHYRTLFTFVGI